MMLKQYPAFMVIQDQHRYILFGHIGTRLLLALNSENRDPCGQERSSLARRISWPHIEPNGNTNATEKRCPGRCLWRVVVTKIDGRGDVDCTDLVICCWPSPEAIPGFRSEFRD